MTFSPFDFTTRLRAVLDIPLCKAMGGHLWQDLAKTTPAVAANDPVAVVTDPYTYRDWTAPSAGTTRPLLVQQSGVWGLLFDGSNDKMAIAPASNIPLPCAAGYRWTATGYAGSGYNVHIKIGSADAGQYNGDYFVYTSTGGIGGTTNDANPHNYVANWSTTTNGCTGHIDGTLGLTSTNASMSAAADVDLARNSAGFPSPGHMSRCIVITGALTGTEQTDVEAWLSEAETTLPTYEFFMPTFLQADALDGLPLVIMQSHDATTWVRKSPPAISFTPSSYDGTSGDYSCIRRADGYWMGYTRTRDATLTGMDTWGMAHSTDGFTWTNLPDVDVSAITGIEQVWAPEPFTDNDGKVYWTFSGSLVTPVDDSKFQIYCIEQLTFDATPTFGTPWLMLPALAVNKSYIDSFLIYTAGAHYLLVKNNYPGILFAEMFKSTTGITGTFSAHILGDFLGSGPIEGPAMIELDSGWRVWGDLYTAGNMKFSDQISGDWTAASGGSTVWAAFATPTGLSGCRHGTPARLPQVYDRRRRLLLCGR